MSTIPTSPLVPGDAGYNDIFDLWDGASGFIELQAEGWLRRVIWPDPLASQPTFTLVCSAEGETSEDLDSDVTGYGLEMSTAQSSFGNRELSKEPVS